jgi:hypothetical protein
LQDDTPWTAAATRLLARLDPAPVDARSNYSQALLNAA